MFWRTNRIVKSLCILIALVTFGVGLIATDRFNSIQTRATDFAVTEDLLTTHELQPQQQELTFEYSSLVCGRSEREGYIYTSSSYTTSDGTSLRVEHRNRFRPKLAARRQFRSLLAASRKIIDRTPPKDFYGHSHAERVVFEKNGRVFIATLGELGDEPYMTIIDGASVTHSLAFEAREQARANSVLLNRLN